MFSVHLDHTVASSESFSTVWQYAEQSDECISCYVHRGEVYGTDASHKIHATARLMHRLAESPQSEETLAALYDLIDLDNDLEPLLWLMEELFSPIAEGLELCV